MKYSGDRKRIAIILLLFALRTYVFSKYQLYFDLFVLFCVLLVLFLFNTKSPYDRLDVIHDLKILIVFDAVRMLIIMLQGGLSLNNNGMIDNKYVFEIIELLSLCLMLLLFNYINRHKTEK